MQFRSQNFNQLVLELYCSVIFQLGIHISFHIVTFTWLFIVHFLQKKKKLIILLPLIFSHKAVSFTNVQKFSNYVKIQTFSFLFSVLNYILLQHCLILFLLKVIQRKIKGGKKARDIHKTCVLPNNVGKYLSSNMEILI